MKTSAESIIPETRVQDIGDAEVPYLVYAGNGPALVLVHATGFLPWLWHPIARELADSYRIYAPFFCDHRRADPEKGGINWLTLGEDLSRFCERLNLEKPFLVGHSMGATLAIIANGACDLPTSGLVLIEPILLQPDYYKMRIGLAQHPLASKAIRRTNSWHNRDEALAYLRSRPLFQHWDKEMLELYLRHGISDENGTLQLTCSPRSEAALFMGAMHYNPWPILSRISCPALVLEGGNSERRGSIDYDRIRTLIPDCVHHRIDGAGHLIPMEKPLETTRHIRQYFGSLRTRIDAEARTGRHGGQAKGQGPDCQGEPLRHVRPAGPSL